MSRHNKQAEVQGVAVNRVFWFPKMIGGFYSGDGQEFDEICRHMRRSQMLPLCLSYTIFHDTHCKSFSCTFRGRYLWYVLMGRRDWAGYDRFYRSSNSSQTSTELWENCHQYYTYRHQPRDWHVRFFSGSLLTCQSPLWGEVTVFGPLNFPDRRCRSHHFFSAAH